MNWILRDKGRIMDYMSLFAALAVVDQQGFLTGWSESARLLTGYPAEEVVGREARGLLAGEGPTSDEVAALAGVAMVRRADGQEIKLAVRAYPVPDEQGGSREFLLVASTSVQLEPTVAEQVFEQASIALSAFDPDRRLLRVNAAACRDIGLTEDELVGRTFDDISPAIKDDLSFLWHHREVFRTRQPVHFEGFGRSPSEQRDHAWNVEMWPVRDASDDVVAVAMAAFDSSEQYLARKRLALLNEAATAIGTTLDVVTTAEELAALAAPRFADFISVDLCDWVLGVREPESTAAGDRVALRRVAHRSRTEGTPEAAIGLGEVDAYPQFSPPARALAQERAVLSGAGDPDFDRWIGEHAARSATVRKLDSVVHSLLAVPLRARGTTLGVAVFVRGSSPDPFTGDDVALAEELASRAAVCVDNARRFARERSTALTLQHSLLPRALPGQAAVEVAHRYLPAGSVAGVGGDWFDVIPLSGGRVALAVGDVVGHGINSSATMGRLRTAVQTLADVDLPPDELLTHLDDLVAHLASGESGDADVADLGATCLYAVYDPVSRRLSLASAGHPPPVLAAPGAAARLVPVSAGPPLGVGGLPFEATELELPEGSLIALYTDGLVEGRHRDFDQGTGELCHLLTAPANSPDSLDTLDTLCDRVLKSLLPERPADDVALLLARTHVLGAEQVATWDLPSDPAQVVVARQQAIGQLTRWHLNEAAFVTELVVSELVTNAIRYGSPPIQLRLIRDRTLICEVSDGNSTSPHLRRAHVFDEGGRGLLLVAQLTQRWGARQTTAGKTIWAEQPLPPS